jgi:hypothetical protein
MVYAELYPEQWEFVRASPDKVLVGGRQVGKTRTLLMNAILSSGDSYVLYSNTINPRARAYINNLPRVHMHRTNAINPARYDDRLVGETIFIDDAEMFTETKIKRLRAVSAGLVLTLTPSSNDTSDLVKQLISDEDMQGFKLSMREVTHISDRRLREFESKLASEDIAQVVDAKLDN